jgi:hypothetical protein
MPKSQFNKIPRLRFVKDVDIQKRKAALLLDKTDDDRLTYIDDNNQKINILDLDMRK